MDDIFIDRAWSIDIPSSCFGFVAGICFAILSLIALMIWIQLRGGTE